MGQIKFCSQSLVENNDIREESLEEVCNSLYVKTMEFVKTHQEEIKTLAAEFEQYTYISSDRIYEICKIIRPKLDTEQA